MAQIQDLPSELIHEIVSYFVVPHSTQGERDGAAVQTLVNLCRTSHVFYEIAQPALYTSVEISKPSGSPLRSLKSYMRTILQRPTLARYTRHLKIYDAVALRYIWSAMLEEDCSLEISALIGGHPGQVESKFIHDSYALEVLKRLPNLEHLYFVAEMQPLDKLMKMLVSEMHSQPSVLSRIKTFTLHKRYERGGLDLSAYIPLISLPTFKEFRTVNDVPDVPWGHPSVNYISKSELTLLWAMFNKTTWHELLTACSPLVSLVYRLPDFDRFNSEMIDIGHLICVTPRDFVKVISQTHCETLRTLTVSFFPLMRVTTGSIEQLADDEDGEHELENSYLTYPPFHDFKCLTSLTIEYDRLNKLEDLPSSLEFLNLEVCRFGNISRSRLTGLIDLSTSICPAIQSVKVSGPNWQTHKLELIVELAMLLETPTRFYTDGDYRRLYFTGTASHLKFVEYAPRYEYYSDSESGESSDMEDTMTQDSEDET
ncbi:unnamed protein product [Periconia digitata]|uniref:Uncharacterized protein n=1 Tax=Periconia digitata TaxID=1303443 RepID=A0A9W4UJ87_9PLEO|nr:unnamed protein product [Periconia digitata]